MRTATRAGTCFEAVASALRARAGFRAAADALEVETGAQSKLGPTQTAKFEADIILWEELATMCRSTHRKWRNSVTLALGSRSHNLDESQNERENKTYKYEFFKTMAVHWATKGCPAILGQPVNSYDDMV